MEPATATDGDSRPRDIGGPCHVGPVLERFTVLFIEGGCGSGLGGMLQEACGAVDVETVKALSEGTVRLTAGGFDAILFDACVDEGAGLQGLRLLREAAPGLPVIIACDEHRDDEQLAARAIGLGAQDCIGTDELVPARLVRILRHAIERNRAVEEARRLSFELEGTLSRRNAELERVNQELESFNSMVSHDLR